MKETEKEIAARKRKMWELILITRRKQHELNDCMRTVRLAETENNKRELL